MLLNSFILRWEEGPNSVAPKGKKEKKRKGESKICATIFFSFIRHTKEWAGRPQPLVMPVSRGGEREKEKEEGRKRFSPCWTCEMGAHGRESLLRYAADREEFKVPPTQ